MAEMTPSRPGELLNIPIGDMLRSVAMAIADAQWSLDKSAIVVAELMTGRRVLRDLETGKIEKDADGKPVEVDSRVAFGFVRDDKGVPVPQWTSMISLGFVPTFYQFVDTTIEIKMAMQIGKNSDGKVVATGTTVDGAYSSSYSFKGDVTSSVKTKIVPIPPPALLEDRIRALIEEESGDSSRPTKTMAPTD